MKARICSISIYLILYTIPQVSYVSLPGQIPYTPQSCFFQSHTELDDTNPLDMNQPIHHIHLSPSLHPYLALITPLNTLSPISQLPIQSIPNTLETHFHPIPPKKKTKNSTLLATPRDIYFPLAGARKIPPPSNYSLTSGAENKQFPTCLAPLSLALVRARLREPIKHFIAERRASRCCAPIITSSRAVSISARPRAAKFSFSPPPARAHTHTRTEHKGSRARAEPSYRYTSDSYVWLININE